MMPPGPRPWILSGFQNYLPIGGYMSDPGAKWNSSQVQDALKGRFGTELLFPVYDTLTGTGANAEYHVIGWVGFHLEDVGSLNGTFVNRHRVESAPLSSGDEIQIGKFKLVFFTGGPPRA